MTTTNKTLPSPVRTPAPKSPEGAAPARGQTAPTGTGAAEGASRPSGAGIVDRFVDRARGLPAVLGKVGGAVQGLGQQIGHTWDRIEKQTEHILGPLGVPLAKAGENLARQATDKLFGLFNKPNDREKFLEQTQDFRKTLGQVRTLGDELSRMSPSDPRYAGVQRAFQQAEGNLSSRYGYTAATAPKPGGLWFDPQFLSKDLANGQITASHFPTKAPVTTPPDPLQAMFGRGRPFQLTGPDGKLRTVSSPEEYKALVAETRTSLGMPRQDGNPVGVHVAFEGGGGKGKRFGPAISEMYSMGVVPTSVSGTSAGSIAAALAASGADQAAIDGFIKDPVIGKFFDLDPLPDDGGVFNGNVAFDTLDKKLRELTGIHDRPVTFADLPIPCQIITTKMSDTKPPPGKEDLSKVENRIFVFSQETTPNTPVALAVRASMAIPGAFDPVQMVDPTTGREVQLVDGGVLDNLPIGYNKSNLPVIGLSLLERDSNHPSSGSNTATPKPLPSGPLDASHILWNALHGYDLMKRGGASGDDFKNRTAPEKNQFMLSLPTWNLENPSQGNSTLGFGYDSKVDPILDGQTRQVTRNFFRNFLDDLGNPEARGTNLTTKVPENLRFETDLTVRGKPYRATYSGGDVVTVTNARGEATQLHLGKQKIEAMYLDHLAFGDLPAQVGKSFDDFTKWWFRLPGHQHGE